MIPTLACAVAIAAILIPTVWAASGTPAPPWLARLIHTHRQRSYRMTDVTPTTAEKPWWQSKTILGGIIAGAGAVAPDLINNAGMFGPHAAPIVTAIGHTAAILGAAFAVYGRFVATAALTK